MEAVYWSDENATAELTASSFTNSMYNYTIGDGITDTKTNKWANAKTTDDGSYWVWIPRYAYKITYYTNSNRIAVSTTKTQFGDTDVLFMYGLSNTHYRDANGNAQPLPDGYKVHPAFQAMTTEEDKTTNPLGKWDVELEGIWVAKYEASREDSTDGVTWEPTTASFGGNDSLTTNAGNTGATKIRVVVKPSVASWKSIPLSNMYANCENMNTALNTHQMKNSEWGAVAYLTYSPYGRNGEEIGTNECNGEYTGAGPGIGTSSVNNGNYAYSTTTVTDENGNITAYAFDKTYAWNTTQGKLASTTGNIYGVYDMSGGTWEYTASYVNNGHATLRNYASKLVNSTNMRNKQIYASTVNDGSDSQSADYNLAASIYGDAIYETSSWCYDYATFPTGNNPLFKRGGGAYDGWRSSGIFNFFYYGSGSHHYYAFRPVICVDSNNPQYAIRYNLNGASSPANISLQIKKKDVSITLSDTIPSRRRYEFKGWATSKENADKQIVTYQPGATYTSNKGITLYAVWESTLIPSIANAPVLGDGMEAVYWSDENATAELTASSFTNSMYNYTMGDGITDTKTNKWANAKTTDDGSYWVWIPRYAYKITYYTNSSKTAVSTTKTQFGDTNVLFMYGLSNTHYRDANGNAQPLPDGYKVHPAFQAMTTEEDKTTNPLGKWDAELEGIWVAKYEASREDSTDNGLTWSPTTDGSGGGNTTTTNAGNTSTTQIRVVVKPSVTSWRNINQSNIYTNCENMNTALNTHQMKNSEWGAVAYLAYSQYGRNGVAVALNQCSSCYTGAGPGIGNSTINNGTYSYSATTVTNEEGNITAYAFDKTYAWNTTQGKLASTTGNIYGVYDMSGGAWEQVASYVNNGHATLINNGKNMVESIKMRNKQVYAVATEETRATNYNLLTNIYGDVTYETSINSTGNGSWNGNYSNYPYSNVPFFCHGGFYNDGTRAGIFHFGDYGGGCDVNASFRPVICIP